MALSRLRLEPPPPDVVLCAADDASDDSDDEHEPGPRSDEVEWRCGVMFIATCAVGGVEGTGIGPEALKSGATLCERGGEAGKLNKVC